MVLESHTKACTFTQVHTYSTYTYSHMLTWTQKKRKPPWIHTGLPASGLPHRTFHLSSHVCACLNTTKACAVAHHRTAHSAALSRESRKKGICEFTTGCWNDCDALAISARVGFKWLRNLNTVFTPLIQSTDWSVFGKFNTRMQDLKPQGQKKLLTTSFAAGCNKDCHCEGE